MSLSYLIQIDFQLSGIESPPNTITQVLGIPPDTALRRGERNRELALPRSNIWSKCSSAPAFDSALSEHWQNLSGYLAGKEFAIRSITGSGRTRFSIIVDGSGRVPPLLIPLEMVQFASGVRADIDVDVYQ